MSPDANRVRTPGDENDRVRVFDTTLRDGEQAPGCTMNLDEKLQVAHQLARLGVDVIEAGYPAASPPSPPLQPCSPSLQTATQ